MTICRSDEKRRRTSNAQRNGKLDGRTGASANSARRSGKMTGAGRKRLADVARQYGKTVQMGWKRPTGSARLNSREEDGKPRARRREEQRLKTTATNLTKQTGRNSRANLSHTLERRREATARQTSTSHYEALSTNIRTIYVNEVV